MKTSSTLPSLAQQSALFHLDPQERSREGTKGSGPDPRDATHVLRRMRPTSHSSFAARQAAVSCSHRGVLDGEAGGGQGIEARAAEQHADGAVPAGPQFTDAERNLGRPGIWS